MIRKIVTAVAVLAVLLSASAAWAQMRPMEPPQGQAPGGPPPAAEPQHPPMGQGMMGEMKCPMMDQGMGMSGQGMMGGMQGRAIMMPGMMEMMMSGQDPKAAARMLKLRGEMMKAMGEIMMKHGAQLEQQK